MTYQLSLKVEREYIIASPFTDDELPTFTEGIKNNKHQLSLKVTYQLSLKVERENIIASSFTDDELTTVTEGRKKIKKTPTFTDGDLPTFTEGRKKKKYHSITVH